MTRAVTTGSTVGSLLVLSMLLRALFPGVAAPSIPASPAVATPARAMTAADEKPPDDGPWRASQNYFAGAVPQCGETPNAPPTRAGRWCSPENTSVLALIAIAPDPVRTHGVAVRSRDRGDRVGRRVGRLRHLAAWLPWSVETPKATSDTAGKSSPAG
jgi:hypothetical protein